MENRFPQIKLSPNLHNSTIFSSPTQRILKEKKPELKFSLSKPLLYNSKNHIVSISSKANQNSSRLPPLKPSQEASLNSLTLSDNLLKLQSNRRTCSNSVITLDQKNVVINYSFKSKTGSVMGVSKDHNQDCYIIQHDLQSQKGQYLFAVCDGHGTEGHHVSQMIKNSLISTVERKLFRCNPADALKKAVQEISEKILHSKIDVDFSGSTLVCVLIIGDFLICANIGDSRAVLGSNLNDWVAIDLTKDQKPNRKDEADRIVRAGGRIGTHEQGGPLRIYYKEQNIPGLAMTRSLGDRISRNIGLISEAEVTERKLMVHDKFIVIASDGLWEFMTSREVVEMVAGYYNQGKCDFCCEKLLRESIFKWNANTVSVDDITIIVIFLNVRY